MRTSMMSVAVAFVLCAGVAQAGQKKSKSLPRSIYVPVSFKVCEHITDAVLYESNADGDEVRLVAELPVKRIFQFTYYPALKRIAPEIVIVKVAGDLPEKRVSTYITITDETVHLSQEKKIELDEKVRKRLRFKRDIHHKLTTITVQCEDHDLPKEVATSG